MRVTVTLHAQAVDLAGRTDVPLGVAAGATAGDVRRALVAAHPELERLATVSALASDQEYLADAALVEERAALHFIPPVSGG